MRWIIGLLAVALGPLWVLSAPIAPTGNAPRPESPLACTSSGTLFTGFHGYSRAPASWNETPIGASAYVIARQGSPCLGSLIGGFEGVWFYNGNVSSDWLRAGVMTLSAMGSLCPRSYVSGSFGWSVYSGCIAEGTQVTSIIAWIGPWGPYPGNQPTDWGYRLSSGTVSYSVVFNPWAAGWSFNVAYGGMVADTGANIPGSAGARGRQFAMGIQAVDTGQFRQVPAYLLNSSYPALRYYSYANSNDDVTNYTDPS